MTEEGARSLGRGELKLLADLIEQLGLTQHFSGDAVMHRNDPIIRSPLTFTNLTLPTTDRLVPYGADPASWPSETS